MYINGMLQIHLFDPLWTPVFQCQDVLLKSCLKSARPRTASAKEDVAAREMGCLRHTKLTADKTWINSATT